MNTRLRYETELIDKIKVIPDYLMPELLNFIDKLFPDKIIPSKKSYKDKVMEYAGDWAEMDDFDDFINEIKTRRTNFLNRRVSI